MPNPKYYVAIELEDEEIQNSLTILIYKQPYKIR